MAGFIDNTPGDGDEDMRQDNATRSQVEKTEFTGTYYYLSKPIIKRPAIPSCEWITGRSKVIDDNVTIKPQSESQSSSKGW